jgi:1-acyl-sn-glycerol-3-phosphate acyltransferase
MKERLGHAFLDLRGWTIGGGIPKAKKYVLIAAPHTSNWDFPYTIALAFALGVDIKWMGKDALFKGPKGILFRSLGGIPVDRGQRTNMVDRMVEMFETHDELVLTVPAEGTRGQGTYWKSGFYHIARRAGVPIALGYLDFGRKRGGIGPLVYPTGDIGRDMDVIRAFYSDVTALKPSNFTLPRLREEDETSG